MAKIRTANKASIPSTKSKSTKIEFKEKENNQVLNAVVLGTVIDHTVVYFQKQYDVNILYFNLLILWFSRQEWSIDRKTFHVAWYWNLRCSDRCISEYLQDTQHGVSRVRCSCTRYFFQRNTSSESNCNRSFWGQPSGLTVNCSFPLHSTRIRTLEKGL